MAQLDTIDLSGTGHKVLVYGPPKGGKTLLTGRIAAALNATWFDLEHGFLTLKQLPLEIQRNINLIRIPDDRTNHRAITTMLALTENKPVDICDVHGKVGARCLLCDADNRAGRKVTGIIQRVDTESLTSNDVIVMDSMTQLSHSAMGLAFGGKQGNLKSVQKAEYDHYTAQGYFLDRVLTMIQQSKANWIVLSHEESLEQEDGKEKIIPMAGTRNFSRTVARYFDHCVYVDIANGKHQQNSIGTINQKILTGSRTGINLSDDTAEGIITLIRSVKGSEAAGVIGNALPKKALPLRKLNSPK